MVGFLSVRLDVRIRPLGADTIPWEETTRRPIWSRAHVDVVPPNGFPFTCPFISGSMFYVNGREYPAED